MARDNKSPITESGYIQYTDTIPYALEVYNCFHKQLNNPLVACEENGNLISFKCIEYAVYCHLPPQYELSLCFRKNGKWWDLKAYSMNQSDFNKQAIQEVEDQLINMFLSC